MTKPEIFILSTDFATLKNDGSATLTVTVPARVVIGASAVWQRSSDIVVGAQGASVRSRIASSRLGSDFYVCSQLTTVGTGALSGTTGSFQYSIAGSIARVSADTLRAQVVIQNPYSATLTSDSFVDEVFTFYVNTFLPPFA